MLATDDCTTRRVVYIAVRNRRGEFALFLEPLA